MQKQENKGEIVIYKADQGPEVKVDFRNENIWLTQAEIAKLFDSDRSVITKHLRNIFKSAELSQNSVCANFAHTASDGKTYKTQYYNLDAIISVGYRVNSKRATQFRIWATQRLKDLLSKGYVVDVKRFKESEQLKLRDLEQTNALFRNVLESHRVSGYEKDLLKIITDYTDTWVTLNQYDTGRLKISDVTKKRTSYLEYEKIKDSIGRFKTRLMASREASELFGAETGNKLAQLLGSVKQSFDGVDVYPSREEKAAHLFYFVIKDHPFVDGNKRIGSLMFILFLIENHILYNRKGERRINDTALAALALLVAESKPGQKDVMIKLIVNLINKK